MTIQWQGVMPAATTQMFPEGRINFEATAKHLEVLIASGITGLVMCGSLGENQTLEPHEKREVVKLAIDVAQGRVPVLSGVAENSTLAAATYVRDIEALGASGVMVLPAMVYKSDDRETITHFRAVAAASDLPILIYNNPIGYGVDITPEMLREMADEPKFQAIKESSGDPRRITDIFNTVGDRYAIFAGVDDLIMECCVVGAVGWIAGVGLAFPTENQVLWNLMQAGKWDEARTLYRWFAPLQHLDIGIHFVQKIKLAIQETGLGTEWVRAPRLPLAGEERDAVLNVIRHALENRPEISAR